MVGLLQQIIDDFVCWVETGIVLFGNLVIKALGAIVAAVIALLPSMPSVPGVPTWLSGGYSYVAYFFPVDWAVTLGISFITFYLAWIVVATVLRWAKVLSGSA